MPTVGRALATERTRQGLDLEAIARITKISPRALQAIEADDFDQLPGLVFARNFVRQYAQVLQLNPESVVQQFDREQSTTPLQSVIPRESAAPVWQPRISAVTFSGLFENSTASAFVTFVLMLVACGLAFQGYEYWRRHRSEPSPSRSAAAAPAPKETGPSRRARTPAAPENAAGTEAAPAEAATSTAPPSPFAPGSKLQVEVTATADCWTRITADAAVVFTGTLDAGETRPVSADSKVVIRAGRASALRFRVNGKEIPVADLKNAIATLTVTTEGIQVRTPTLDPVVDF